MQVLSLLHPRCSHQFNIAGVSCIGGFIGAANSASGRAAIRIGPVAHKSNVPFCDGFLQALVLSLCNEHCNLSDCRLKRGSTTFTRPLKMPMFLVESKKASSE